jgi:hypothetical protein
MKFPVDLRWPSCARELQWPKQGSKFSDFPIFSDFFSSVICQNAAQKVNIFDLFFSKLSQIPMWVGSPCCN